MARKIRHAGIIELDVEFLLKILDLDGGEIHDIYMKDNYLPHKVIRIVVEHPDLPKIVKDKPLNVINLIHQTTCGDNGVPIKIERVDPPKQIGGKK